MTELIIGAVKLNLTPDVDGFTINLQRDEMFVGRRITHRLTSISFIIGRSWMMVRMSLGGGEQCRCVGSMLFILDLNDRISTSGSILVRRRWARDSRRSVQLVRFRFPRGTGFFQGLVASGQAMNCVFNLAPDSRLDLFSELGWRWRPQSGRSLDVDSL
jgi:hypothetical protein